MTDLEVRTVHGDYRAAADGAARRAVRRDPGWRVIRVRGTAHAVLLPIERHLDAERLVAHQRIRNDLDAAHKLLVERRARATADAKLPARQRAPAGHRQVGHQKSPVADHA